jgi:hypothetical protein
MSTPGTDFFAEPIQVPGKWIEFLVGHRSLIIFKLEGERLEGTAGR